MNGAAFGAPPDAAGRGPGGDARPGFGPDPARGFGAGPPAGPGFGPNNGGPNNGGGPNAAFAGPAPARFPGPGSGPGAGPNAGPGGGVGGPPGGAPHGAPGVYGARPGVPGSTTEDDPDQQRFNSFKPEEPAEAAKEEPPAPPPQVRNGRVLAAVLAAAVLLLVIPLGAVWLFSGGGKDTYNPAVGDCVKQAGSAPAKATCGEAGSYKVTAKQASTEQCPDANQPHLVVKESDGSEQVLCLEPAAS
ncbi:hypothetical protein [Plantactinospora sp. KBS50]|uniref:LppU/SCO3897 family protein n=1 Tax=Plantactinospora sp. KBS50 TaxID=2024580 RepID=UPI0018DF6DB2|nr:hypothetical protein [Plantactinospora sp. KBS50]